MPDYQKMYYTLLQESAKAIDILQNALHTAEDMYINAPQTPLSMLDPETKEEEDVPPSIH